MQEYKSLLESKLVNPISAKSFIEEKREIKINQNGVNLEIRYESTGINPENKRKVEQQITQLLAPTISEDKIFVSSFTNTNISSPAVSTPEVKTNQPAANLKVGHAAPSKKKRVANIKKVIAVSSCKGGVGKSSVTANLALALVSEGLKVGILDADIYGPSMPMLLNKRSSKPMASDAKKILPIEAFGLKFMSFGLFVDETEPVIWRGPMLGGVLNQFLFDVDWGELDILIVDLPPGTGDMQLSLVQNTELDGVVVVSTPQDVAILDSVKGLKMFKQVNIPILGLVENMSFFVAPDTGNKYYIFGNGGVQKKAKELGESFLGEIPLDISLREGSDKGEPFMSIKKNESTQTWKAFISLAKNVIKETGVLNDASEKKSIFKRIFN
jgi:ATP-binding protein involved in chromosome partitioning